MTATLLRAKLGESKDSIARFNQPLELATSSSPDALQFLALGYQSHLHGDLPAAMADYNRSIEKDPNLALAYAAEGSIYSDLGPDPRDRDSYEGIRITRAPDRAVSLPGRDCILR